MYVQTSHTKNKSKINSSKIQELSRIGNASCIKQYLRWHSRETGVQRWRELQSWKKTRENGPSERWNFLSVKQKGGQCFRIKE